MRPPDRYIERSFPIVALNPLSARERNAFKPVYKMHKWFARRSASIFRAILLGSALPFEDGDGKPTELMEEFYRGHGTDPRLRRPDGTPLRVLDPFMGGGTTVVEALRLGFDVTGVDYNPIAWFIVRGETTPVDLVALDAAYQRVAAKVKEELLELYRTPCPLTGKPADIIYAFWVKQGICVDPTCRGLTDLFKGYEVARKRGDCSLSYRDQRCPHCDASFDWELERATITAGGPQIAGTHAWGKGRPSGTPSAFGLEESGVTCPHCVRFVVGAEAPRAVAKKKTVPLHVLVDPSTGDFFEVRGDIPASVTAPASGFRFDPGGGPMDGGKFSCGHCGRRQDVVESARASGKPLPFRYYGYYAHTPHAAGRTDARAARECGLPTNNEKWFAAVTAADLAKVASASEELERHKADLPLPTQPIYDGYNTNRLVIHQYRRWSDVYGPRQLLALGKLLNAIGEEPEPTLRDALLAGFKVSLGCMSNLALYNVALTKVERVNSAHDYRNPTTTAETNVWGLAHGRGAFSTSFGQAVEGLDPAASAWEWRIGANGVVGPYHIVPDVAHSCPLLINTSGTGMSALAEGSIDLIVTDPPYAGSVQYAEMSDWYYVWLHHILKDHYPNEFGSSLTLKAQEIIEDHGPKGSEFFFTELTKAFAECRRVLTDDGLLVFTFHHAEGSRWTGLLKAIFDAGFYLVAAYPTHSEALNSIVIQATKGITYDIIHVCRKREAEPEEIAWSRLRRDVLRDARQQLAEIEGAKDVLPGPDVQMILLGKALRRFSEHYGRVIGADGKPIDLIDGIDRVLKLVEEVRGESLPLPGALQDVDSLTQLALLHVAGKPGWTRDGLHVELRGYVHGLDALLDAGLVREVKGEKGQLEPVPPLERARLREGTFKSDGPVIDSAHLVLGRIDSGKSVDTALFARRGQWLAIKETIVWIGRVEPALGPLCELAVRHVEALGPDDTRARAEQVEAPLDFGDSGPRGKRRSP